jgi:hypothetical protein
MIPYLRCFSPSGTAPSVTLAFSPVADDWEDWEEESFEPKVVAGASTNGQKFETKGQAVLASVKEPDESKFAGEDEEEDAPPSWEEGIPKPQQVMPCTSCVFPCF